MSPHRPKAIFCIGNEFLPVVFPADLVEALNTVTRIEPRSYSLEAIRSAPDAMREVEFIFTGWGGPLLDAAALEFFPHLRAVFATSGGFPPTSAEALRQRGIHLSTAQAANAIPVVDFCFASILLALKQAWQYQHQVRSGTFQSRDFAGTAGAYKGTRVGLVSLGAIGTQLSHRLQAMELTISAYDPFVPDAHFQASGVLKVESLEALFRDSHVVSIHLPEMPATRKLISGALLRSMPKGATLINTSRGSVINEPELIEVLRERPDLFAVLDVITDESNYSASPLAQLPNVFLTPHIAGSMGNECRRLGEAALSACRAFVSHDSLRPPLTTC